MAYTPEYSQRQSAVLRRIAWAMKIPMTQAQAVVFDFAVNALQQKTICEACRDQSFCSQCPFSREEIHAE